MRKQQGSTVVPLSLFISYAHEDEPLRQQLETHLSLLQRQGLIASWHDHQILAGDEWAHDIDEHLETASIILLLISADFLASDYCYSQEMTRALQRHAAGKAQVIPILVRSCDWSSAPFALLQVLPTTTRPVTAWPDQDEAWTNVVTGIRYAVQGRPVLSEDTASITSDPTSTASPFLSTRAQSPSTLDLRNRMRFLSKLHNSYNDLLQASLQDAAQIALSFHSKPDAVTNPMRLRLRQPHLPEKPLPTETTLLQVFDRTSGELLILGDPGAGKTTLLLNLAEALYQRAQQDTHALIPVIVNLSTWATTRKPLAVWLIEEIMKSYEVPRGPIARWTQQNQLLPLLDGLDEVDASVLPACIEAINTYKQQHLVPLVVCCRTGEYDAQQRRLMLQNAVVIQPLEEEQVDVYFRASGKSLAGIRSVLRKNAELRELVRTPLMLHVVTLTYQGVPMQALPKKGTMQQQQQQIFEQYVQRMLALPQGRFTAQLMMQWLSWLAQQMRRRNLTVFYLEHLQPEWLPLGRAQRIYDILAVRVYGALLGLLVGLLVGVMFSLAFFLPELIWLGLMGGLLGGLITGSETATFQFTTIFQRWEEKGEKLALLSLGSAICIGLSTGYACFIFGNSFISQYASISGLSFGLCAFLLCCSIEAGKRTEAPDTPLPWQHRTRWKRWLVPGLRMGHLRLGFFVGLLFGMSEGLIDGLSEGRSAGLSGGLSIGLGNGLSAGLSFGIIGIVLSLLLVGSKQGIALTEIITWSLPRFTQSLFGKAHLRMTLCLFLFTSLFLVLCDGVSNGLRIGTVSTWLDSGVSNGLSIGLIYWILLGVWNSLSQDALDDHRRSTPNQGVKRSVQNGTLLGLLAGILCGLVVLFTVIFSDILFYGLSGDLSFGVSVGPREGPIIALMAAITGGLLIWLVTGGLAGLRHLLLRILLARAGLLPWRTIRFLDEATRRILLYRDGGGYRFIHRLLLEYFASLETPSPKEASIVSVSSPKPHEKV